MSWKPKEEKFQEGNNVHKVLCVQLFMTLCTIAHQALLFIGFLRQESWSGLPFLSLGIKPTSLKSFTLAGGFFTTIATWGALKQCLAYVNVQKILHLL